MKEIISEQADVQSEESLEAERQIVESDNSNVNYQNGNDFLAKDDNDLYEPIDDEMSEEFVNQLVEKLDDALEDEYEPNYDDQIIDYYDSEYYFDQVDERDQLADDYGLEDETEFSGLGEGSLDLRRSMNEEKPSGDIRIKIEVEYLNNYADERKNEHRGALQRYVKKEFNHYVDEKFKNVEETLKNELKNSIIEHYVESDGTYEKLIDTDNFEGKVENEFEKLTKEVKSEMDSALDKYETFGHEFEHYMNKAHEQSLMEHDMYQQVSQMLGLMKYMCSVKDTCSTSDQCPDGCGCTAGACFCCKLSPEV